MLTWEFMQITTPGFINTGRLDLIRTIVDLLDAHGGKYIFAQRLLFHSSRGVMEESFMLQV